MLIGHHKLVNQPDFDGSAADADAQPVTQDARAHVTERIRAAADQADPPDTVLLSLHGAMVTEIDESLPRNHVLPSIGAHRRGELQPSDFLDIQTRLLEAGEAPGIADRVPVLWRCNCAMSTTRLSASFRALKPDGSPLRWTSRRTARSRRSCCCFR